MKYIVNIVLMIVFAGNIISCDDFLDSESKSTFTEEMSFSNISFATYVVNGIYDHFTDSYSYANVLLFAKSGSDIEMVPGSSDNARRDLAQYKAGAGNTQITSMWNKFYSAIEQANICIDNLPISPIWQEAEAKALYGEAVTLRALCYYELITLFGDVPFHTKSTQSQDYFFVPKTDRDEIFEYLVEDLKKVEDYVPWMEGSATRVTKGFVKGLRARIALTYAGYSLRNKTFETKRGRRWQEYYKISNQECKELFNSGKHGLNPSFKDVFMDLHAYVPVTDNKEILYEIGFGRLISGRISQVIGMRFPTSPPHPKYGRAAAEIACPMPYFYSFSHGDSRREVSCELYNYNNTSTPLVQNLIGVGDFKPTKWRRSWITPNMGGDLATVQYTGVNWPVMRYSDVLLMLAETEIQVYNVVTDTARIALKLIRERAFPDESMWTEKVTNYIDSVSASVTLFFNAIVDERAWEFGGELIRRNDLHRWNLMGKKLQDLKDAFATIVNGLDENVPRYLYYRIKEDGETLEILNPDYNHPADGATLEINGIRYSVKAWMANLDEKNKTSALGYVDANIGGYNAAKNNHLLPLSNSIISTSNGTLSNDQIPQ